MTKPKVIFFDIGNVLVRLRTEEFLRGMVAVCDARWNREAVLEAIREPQGPHIEYEKGRMSGEDFYAHVRGRFQMRLDYPGWLRLWNDYFEPNRPMEALVARLRGQCRFFTLSNTNAEHLAHMKRNFRVLDAMEVVLASNELGARKPEPEIFQMALQRAGVRPEEALYIDDVERFMGPARALGLQAFHYTYNDDKLRGALLAYGFKLSPLSGSAALGGC